MGEPVAATMPDEFELNDAEILTIGTIGPPGKRTFHIQAQEEDTLLTFTIEKFQAAAIADSVTTLLQEIEKEYQITTPEVSASGFDLELQEPILPIFRVGQIGIGYDAEQDRVFLILSELLPEDADLEAPRTARIGTTRENVRALVEHTHEVVAAGRPICGNCGEPIDPEGHFCPKSNGHRKAVPWA